MQVSQSVMLATAATVASAREKELAAELKLSPLTPDQVDRSEIRFLLRWEAAGLTLYDRHQPRQLGLRVDFAGSVLRRRSSQSLARQNLGRAAGLKPGQRPRVIDATAGLGSDAFLLAAAGCQVDLLERHPLVHAMLRDGMQRGAAEPELADTLLRMRLAGYELASVQDLNAAPVVYLDPMFPLDRRSARSRKSMAMLQALLGVDEESPELLALARQFALRRVVVKRGKRSPAYAGIAPDLSFDGSSSRYDVYLKSTENGDDGGQLSGSD